MRPKYKFNESANYNGKKALRIMSFECRNAHSNPFFRHEIIILPDKILMENFLFISESINFDLSPIFNHWLTFSSDSHNYETQNSSKGMLKVKTVKTKKYGRAVMIMQYHHGTTFKKYFISCTT